MDVQVPQEVLERWGASDCHVLTIALHRRTGWPIVALHDGRISGGRQSPLDDYGMLCHSGVLSPDGRFLDIRGMHGRAELETVEDRYVEMPELWARWSGIDERWSVDDLLAKMPQRGEELERGLMDAEQAIETYLFLHLPAFGSGARTRLS